MMILELFRARTLALVTVQQTDRSWKDTILQKWNTGMLHPKGISEGYRYSSLPFLLNAIGTDDSAPVA
jgi:hypothetical protein